MEIAIAIGIIVIFVAGWLCGYVDAYFKRADYFSEQLKVVEWQRDQAIQQRDQAIQQRDAIRRQIGIVTDEVNKLWAHDAKRADHPTH